MFPSEVVATNRLVLRPFAIADAAAVVDGCSDGETQRWLPMPRPFTPAVAEGWCSGGAEQLRLDGDGVQLAIADAADDRLVGGVCLKKTSWVRGYTEIGYWMRPGLRGRGFAAEATAGLARWGLGHERIHRVELTAATGNIASQRVALKAGFTFEGVARSAGYTHTGRVDLRVYSLVRGDV
ncbi:GNAT family N-acetyltransferase [Actinoplanes sp. LDG1-06]|uniref:GNAT family N-acetyltransferase n=1 Tax=Paractinoplanes ovalisporus TaxID=2810368 RepID=A0ABS2AIT2_9ACTN|nr:GNAT family N-acetyltransferase [Actinoplanes ovalisporus]MBM2619753.1 GNAT family N-acetyltransferase [Actinoplanes ovalisporus]